MSEMKIVGAVTMQDNPSQEVLLNVYNKAKNHNGLAAIIDQCFLQKGFSGQRHATAIQEYLGLKND